MHVVTEQTHERVDLANEQLAVALELFLSRRSMVSAITLAGAAEEILGQALTLHSRDTSLMHEYSVAAPVEELLWRKPYKLKDFIDQKNRVRN